MTFVPVFVSDMFLLQIYLFFTFFHTFSLKSYTCKHFLFCSIAQKYIYPSPLTKSPNKMTSILCFVPYLNEMHLSE